MLSDAYDKKCKVLMALGQYSSAIHFGRLSAVLDTGEFSLLWYHSQLFDYLYSLLFH